MGYNNMDSKTNLSRMFLDYSLPIQYKDRGKIYKIILRLQAYVYRTKKGVPKFLTFIVETLKIVKNRNKPLYFQSSIEKLIKFLKKGILKFFRLRQPFFSARSKWGRGLQTYFIFPLEKVCLQAE